MAAQAPTEGTTAPDSAVAAPTTDVRSAHAAGDVASSKSLHDAKAAGDQKKNTELHGGVGSGNIKSIVFGGLDGIITTFSTIASVAGGSLPVHVIITLGFANLIADGIAMGLGDGLSSHAEMTFQARGGRGAGEQRKCQAVL